MPQDRPAQTLRTMVTVMRRQRERAMNQARAHRVVAAADAGEDAEVAVVRVVLRAALLRSQAIMRHPMVRKATLR